MWFPETRAAWRKLRETYQSLPPDERAFIKLTYIRAFQRWAGAGIVACTAGILLGPAACAIIIGAALWIEGTME